VAGGTLVEPSADGTGWHNTAVMFEDGREIGRYRKIRLMPGEIANGARPGSDPAAFVVRGVRVAPVICADVLDPATFDRIAALDADLIVAPVASPFLAADTADAKERRDREIFLAGATRARAAIVKVCGVGSIFGRPLQGRSLVVSPEGVHFRVPFDREGEPGAWVVDVPLPGR
jgi:predicted amidohydrolase